MNKELFEEKWKLIRGQTQSWWSLFSEEDLKKVEKAPIKRDKYVVMLQVKYGFTRQSARAEIGKRLAEYEAGLEPKIVPAAGK